MKILSKYSNRYLSELYKQTYDLGKTANKLNICLETLRKHFIANNLEYISDLEKFSESLTAGGTGDLFSDCKADGNIPLGFLKDDKSSVMSLSCFDEAVDLLR
jgi:hypothetical protein